MEEVRYRANVAGVVCRRDGLVLVGERLDIPGAWQFPQGGVDPGETPEEAVRRELAEEIGLDGTVAHEIRSRSGPHRYLYPDKKKKSGYSGQEQTYFLIDLHGDGAELSPDAREFSRIRWVSPEQVDLGSVMPVKREIYRKVLRDFFGVEFKG